MDSKSIHGQDIASFDLPSTHRLPTVSAADALEELDTDPTRFLGTGLDDLDEALSPEFEDTYHDQKRPGGFQRGQVIEIWGPPGSGKTTFGLQVAADGLRKGGKVVWVDGYRPVCGNRLSKVLQGSDSSTARLESGTGAAGLSNFIHFTCPSLAHFIALLCRPTAACIPAGTSLIVIDAFSALLTQAFPKTQEPRSGQKEGHSASLRRLQVLQSTISSLQKLAATRDVTIIILSHCVTRMQAGRGATLIPAINTSTWDQGIATRLVLFRDWSVRDERMSGVRFAGIQKLNGRAHSEVIGPTFAFEIYEDKISPVTHDSTQASAMLSSATLPKRKLGETEFEIADSEDEEYGWDNEDLTQLPPNPSQWQGSEDILVGQHDEDGNRRDDDSDDNKLGDSDDNINYLDDGSI